MAELKKRVLIVDDEEMIAQGLSSLLEDQWEVRIAFTGKDALVAFAEFAPDVVLLDVALPDFSGVELLRQFKLYSESSAVIMMSGNASLPRVVESMQLGAETFLQKPFDSTALSLAMEQATKIVEQRKTLEALRRAEKRTDGALLGVSPSIVRLNDVLGQIARAPSPVLIEGESGTGKGVLARLLHNRSNRAKQPFVDLNCAGLSRELLESELFGHERGAFTNAMNVKQGLFEIASEGTLFLDEIGEMEPSLQARVLKALEEKKFRRVGGVRDLRADFRLVAATNRDLQTEVNAGRFRADLYYRLNVVKLRMPPLRERLEDLPLLCEEILGGLAKDMGRPRPQLSPRAIAKLSAYAWPGNVRELRNVLERTLLTLAGNEIRTEHLSLDGSPVSVVSSSRSGLPEQEWEIQPLDTVITDYVRAAVEATGSNMRKAARLLQISPSTLYARLKVKPVDA